MSKVFRPSFGPAVQPDEKGWRAERLRRPPRYVRYQRMSIAYRDEEGYIRP